MTQIEQQHQQHREAHQGPGAFVEVAEEQRDTGHQQHHHRYGQQTQQADQQSLWPAVLALDNLQSQTPGAGNGT
ncbi:hypothetical protein D3C78_1972180 [compost metagenome]